MSHLYLYEILVPAYYPNGAEIMVYWHHRWDKRVKEIANGLTIGKTAKGTWIDMEGNEFAEVMIPVRIMCTEEQIEKISDITAEHYAQKAVMFYKVSDSVKIKHYPTVS